MLYEVITVAEDLPGASFAGQYDTILNVSGEDALKAAVLQCFAPIEIGSVGFGNRNNFV